METWQIAKLIKSRWSEFAEYAEKANPDLAGLGTVDPERSHVEWDIEVASDVTIDVIYNVYSWEDEVEAIEERPNFFDVLDTALEWQQDFGQIAERYIAKYAPPLPIPCTEQELEERIVELWNSRYPRAAVTSADELSRRDRSDLLRDIVEEYEWAAKMLLIELTKAVYDYILKVLEECVEDLVRASK